MTRNEQRDEIRDFVQGLIDGGQLMDAALGVAKMYVDHGDENFSDKQKWVFDKYIIKEHTIKECKRCGNDVEWDEMNAAIDNGGYCGFCSRQMEKS